MVERAADFEVPVPLDPAPVPVGEFEPVVAEPVVVELQTKLAKFHDDKLNSL